MVFVRGLGLRDGPVTGETTPPTLLPRTPEPPSGADDHENDAGLQEERGDGAQRIGKEQVEAYQDREENDEDDSRAHESPEPAPPRTLPDGENEILVNILDFSEKAVNRWARGLRLILGPSGRLVALPAALDPRPRALL